MISQFVGRRENGVEMGGVRTIVDVCMCFFFSSRRRHTRSLCDWSSDVCSSDLSTSLVTRVTNDVETVRAFTGNGILQLLNAVVMLIGSATILLITNWKLALVALLIIPAILGIFLFFLDRKSTRLNSSHTVISYAVFCLKKKKH